MQLTQFHGQISTFGGPGDNGVARDEGLSLIEPDDLNQWWFRYLFLPEMDSHLGLARNLNPEAYYIACRWDYDDTPRSLLRGCFAKIENVAGKVVFARPVDWGPNARLKRAMDLSPGVAKRLSLNTGDIAKATLILPITE
jgi:hypothetical protein